MNYLNALNLFIPLQASVIHHPQNKIEPIEEELQSLENSLKGLRGEKGWTN